MYQRPVQATSSHQDFIRWADWIELNVLTQEEPTLSMGAVTASIAEDPPDDSTASEYRLDYSDSSGDLDPATLHNGYWQNAERIAELAFSELRQRSRWFGVRYPLIVQGETVITDSSFDSSTVAEFLTLLRSRHLYCGALDDDGELAGELFEELLPHALGCYLGTSRATAIRFGVAGNSRGNGLPLETDQAMDNLSSRMNEPRGDLANLRNSSDYGADAVVWKPLGDNLRGKLTAIGQATISEGIWTSKRPSPKWRSGRLIRLFTQPTIVVAFVESISLTNKNLLDGLPENNSPLPLDRFRILFVLRDQDVPPPLRNRMCSWSLEMIERLPR